MGKKKEVLKKGASDFKEFALKGNIVDMAVGVIIGGAFSTIVASLVSDIIKPLISMIGNVDLTNKFVVLGGEEAPATLAEAQELGLNTLNWGLFVTNIINFVIIALVMFIVIKKLFNAFKKEEAPAEPTTKECPYCLSEVPIKATKCPHCTSELK
jgi:large conductance mechanosensitive channel